MIRFLRALLTVAALVYLIVLGALYAEQREFLFHRSTGRPMLADAALESRRSIVCLTTADGLALRAWYFAPTHRGAPVILFLHGNAGDMGDHLSVVKPLLARGDGVLALEYRGYGGNPGDPSENGLYDDARAALDFLQRQNIDPKRLVLFGESLGTGIAVQMAVEMGGEMGGERPVAAVILRSPYTSIADVAARQFPIFPVRWLVRDKFDSLSKIARIHAPLLIEHGELDALIPIDIGRRLFDAASEPKTWAALPGIGHNDIGRAADGIALDFLDRVVPDADPTPETARPADSLASCGA